MVRVVRVYCDGSGFNTINSAYCVILHKWKRKTINGKEIVKDKKELKVLYEDKGVYEIEYLALITALKICEDLKKDDYQFNIYSDSKCVVEEVNLRNKPKNKELFNEARRILDENKNIWVSWIPRTENIAGIYLEKRLRKLHNYRNQRWSKR